MVKAQFNTKLIHVLKDILLCLHHGDSTETVQKDFDQHFTDVSSASILLILLELKNGNYGITSEDIIKFFNVYSKVFDHSLTEWDIPESQHPGHPVQIFKEENKVFQSMLDQMNNLLETLEKNPKEAGIIERLKGQMSLLGQFYSHYNRKEKLIFPILERYGHYMAARIMWGNDDRIRNLYKGTKRMMEKMPELEFQYVRKSYDLFAIKFEDMIFEEEAFLLPILSATFNEDDWSAIAEESDAFGFAIAEPEEEWVPERELLTEDAYKNKDIDGAADVDAKHLALGGGYLTIQEADNILNNLPLEITFVDKNGIFKYFNEIVESSEMMFVRTPTSIGRNVANCHPPKSLKKVMKLIRDLKTKKRTSENMWFKKKDQYVHITYKGVFNEDGEYLGILEYVQDIQPFLDLPRKVKKELKILDEAF